MKNKKILSIVIFVLCLLSLVVLAACGGDKCKDGHTGEWRVLTPATEDAVGYESRTCTVCGETENREIAKLAHVHAYGEWVVITESTETTKGSKERTCACGEKETQEIALLGHTHAFGTWTVKTAATATTHGIEERACACGEKEERELHSYALNGKCEIPECGETDPEAVYTYNQYLTLSPSNWNELTYQDNNDTEIMNFIGINFFGYDYKYDEDGNIVEGQFEIIYQGATALEDITQEAAIKTKYGFKDTDKGMAYRITLRNDLKWETGEAIHAADYVYTMKQQLDPLFQNYRADSYYTGATVIKNAEGYAKQGMLTYGKSIGKCLAEGETLADYIEAHADDPCYINWDYSFGAMYDFEAEKFVAAEDAIIKAPKTLKEFFEFYTGPIIQAGVGQDQATLESWFPDEVYCEYLYPTIAWDEVGIYAEDELNLVLVLDIPLVLLKEDGTLSYKAAYNMASLPLVHQATYESCKEEPQTGSTLYTSTYNSSLETTVSCGPYKLVSFQTGKEFTLERNEYWFGYNMEENEGLYQTDRIYTEIVGKWATAFLKFRAGELDGIGIDVSVATEYKGSERAYFTPDDFVNALQLQSNKAALAERETDGINKTMMAYTDFRKALSLSIDRAAYNVECTTASKAGFGLFGPVHYYDVANGGVYRFTDPARETLCDVYAIDVEEYDGNWEEAANAITGYNLTVAKQLVREAYAAALAAGDINETDVVKLTFGTGSDNETVRRRYDFVSAAWTELAKETPLEGRLTTEFKDFGTKWANDFRAGAYDVCMGGWTGAAWDPGYFLLAYLHPNYMYSKAWNTAEAEMTLTLEGDSEGCGIEITMGLLEWYACLNGTPPDDTEDMTYYNWGAGIVPESVRLQIIAALEREVLGIYYTVPISYNYGASLIGYKVEFKSYTYNTFMAYGGMKYMTYNYTDANWAEYLQNNELDYTTAAEEE